MISIKRAIDRAKIKTDNYNKLHKRQYRPYVIVNKILWLFWLNNKVNYIPFWGPGNLGVSQKELKQIGRIL
jgi:hypothetical protein